MATDVPKDGSYPKWIFLPHFWPFHQKTFAPWNFHTRSAKMIIFIFASLNYFGMQKNMGKPFLQLKARTVYTWPHSGPPNGDHTVSHTRPCRDSPRRLQIENGTLSHGYNIVVLKSRWTFFLPSSKISLACVLACIFLLQWLIGYV